MITLLLSTLLALATPVRAEPSPEWQACAGGIGYTSDQSIAACTAIINAGAVASKKDLARAFANRCAAVVTAGDPERALSDCTKAIELDPTLGEAYRRRALCYYNLGKPELSIADSTRAINLDPTDYKAYTIRGNAWGLMKRYDNAIESYDQAIRLNPGFADAWSNRGAAYEKKGLYERAIEDFDQAIRLRPDFANAWFNRGHAYRTRGEYERAIRDYNEVIRLQPKDAGAYNDRGLCYNKLGQYDRAVQDFDRALELRPDYPFALNNRGVSYNGMGLHDRAIEDLDHAIRLKPDYPEAYNNRGIAYAEKGLYDGAINDFSQAIQLRANFPEALGNRGFVYLKKGTLGDLDQAIADSEQALKLSHPNPTYVRTNLEEAKRAKDALLAQANAKGTGARVALIVGNSTYLHAPRLPNTRNDVEDVATELKKLGYQVFGYPRTDFTRTSLLLEIEAFKKSSIGASAAVIWYSGHGQQMLEEGAETPNDFIIPVDARIDKRADVAPNAIRLDALKIAVLPAKQLRMVVVDACRNNPFYVGSRATRGMGRSPATPGVLLIQSTQPGNIAQDGAGRNSPFTQAFLAELRKSPRRDVRQLFSAVQGGVESLTRHEQKPQIDDGLATGDTVAMAP